MMFIDYANNKIEVDGCPTCAFIRGEFSLPCGEIYQDKICVINQDWELPINGFIVVSPIKCVERFDELKKEERAHIFEMVNKVISILRKNDICKMFNVLFEEKINRHLHIWIQPRDGWNELGIDPTKDIGQYQQYALTKLKTNENFEAIKKTVKMLGKELDLERNHQTKFAF